MASPFQFSLRSLFVAMLFVCAGLASFVTGSALGAVFAFFLWIGAFGYLVDGVYGAMISVLVVILAVAATASIATLIVVVFFS